MTVRLLGRSGDAFESAIQAQSVEAPEVIDGRWMGINGLEVEVFGDTPAADIALVPADWLPRLVHERLIRPIAPHPGDSRAWCATFLGMVSDESGLWALPYHDGPQLLLYRRDLFDDPAERAGYEARYGEDLTVPTDWAAFERVARWFTLPDRGLYGTVFAGLPDGHSNVYDFVLQLRRFGGEVLGEDGRCVLDSAAARAALGWLHGVTQDATVVDPAARDWDSVTSGRRFADGRVAMMVNWAGYAGYAAQPDSAIVGKVDAALAPRNEEGGPAETVAAIWTLVILRGAGDPEAAERTVRHLTTAAADRAGTFAGASGARLDTWRDTAVRAQVPAVALFEQAHQHSRPLPPVAELPVVVSCLNALVDRVVRLGGDMDIELAVASREIDAVLERSPL